MVDSEREVPLIELIVKVEPVIVVKYLVVVDTVGTWIDDKTVNEEVTCASCEVKKFDWMELVVRLDVARVLPLIELTVRVEVVSEVKYPVVVDKVGTRREERTVKEEVTWTS